MKFPDASNEFFLKITPASGRRRHATEQVAADPWDEFMRGTRGGLLPGSGRLDWLPIRVNLAGRWRKKSEEYACQEGVAGRLGVFKAKSLKSAPAVTLKSMIGPLESVARQTKFLVRSPRKISPGGFLLSLLKSVCSGQASLNQVAMFIGC